MPPRRPQPGHPPPRDLLFTLVPAEADAAFVLQHNPAHVTHHLGVPGLACYADRPYNIPGRLLSFGRNGSNDIRLPSGRARGSDTDQNYRNDHFFFYLAPSGELIIRDLSNGRTAIEIPDATFEEAALHDLRGTNPRQRVIPRTADIHLILFGVSARFKMIWGQRYRGEPSLTDSMIQGGLGAQALARHVSGMTITTPNMDSLYPPGGGGRQLRSRYTPSTGTSLNGQVRQIHKYGPLGEGAYGRVCKAVDLATGALWAVKEIKDGAGDDRWKASFLQELELHITLRHDHIVHFETYQGFQIGGSFQLFFTLYKGSLVQLIQHACDPPSRCQPPRFWNNLVPQMSSALAYLHRKQIVHCDIKPANIMFDHAFESDTLHFFLGDFGLSMSESASMDKLPGGGTTFYNAPELDDSFTPTPASDVWALGVTLGQVLGYWCSSETARSAAYWDQKLAAFGCPHANYRDPRNLDDEDEIWMHRAVTFARDAIIPTALALMLSNTVSERPSASQLERIPIADFSDLPRESAAARAAMRSVAAGMAPPPPRNGNHRPLLPAPSPAQPRQTNTLARPQLPPLPAGPLSTRNGNMFGLPRPVLPAPGVGAPVQLPPLRAFHSGNNVPYAPPRQYAPANAVPRSMNWGANGVSQPTQDLAWPRDYPSVSGFERRV